ncbi:DUF4249 family protein [candidate division KSB1 bacterium]|nr:DUF4249 family protein [candidate division KSB1 bacterium]
MIRNPVPRKLTLLLFLSMLGLRCLRDDNNVMVSPQVYPPVIHAILNTAADSQYVILANIIPPESVVPSPVVQEQLQFFRQAQIRLESEGSLISFPNYLEQEMDYTHQIIWISQQSINPGQTYHLQVAVPGQGLFNATTTTPGDFEILTPDSTDTMDVQRPLEVTWTPAAGAAGYRVTLWSFVEDCTRFNLDRPPGSPEPEIWYAWEESRQLCRADTILKMVLKHDFYNRFYQPREVFIVNLWEVRLGIQALDSAAWFAEKINATAYQNIINSDYRIEPIAYSNFDRGYGVFTATTSKTIPIPIPGGQK